MAFEIDGPVYYFGNIVSPFTKNGNPAINLSDVIEIYNIYNDPNGKYTERVNNKRRWKEEVPYLFRRLSNIVNKPGFDVLDENVSIPTLSDVIEAYNWFNGSGSRNLSDPNSYNVLIYDTIAPTPTSTQTPTPTPTITHTTTQTPTNTPTYTCTNTYTPTVTPTNTTTPTVTPSDTPQILKYLANTDFNQVYQISDDLNKFQLDYLGYTENLTECPTDIPLGVKVSGFKSGDRYSVGYELYSRSTESNVSLNPVKLETFTAVDTSREFLTVVSVNTNVDVFVIRFIINDLTNNTSENNYFIFRCP